MLWVQSSSIRSNQFQFVASFLLTHTFKTCRFKSTASISLTESALWSLDENFENHASSLCGCVCVWGVCVWGVCACVREKKDTTLRQTQSIYSNSRADSRSPLLALWNGLWLPPKEKTDKRKEIQWHPARRGLMKRSLCPGESSLAMTVRLL